MSIGALPDWMPASGAQGVGVSRGCVATER